MTESKDIKKFEQVVQKIDPQSKLLRTWELKGGISARMMALEIERSDSQTKKMIVRQYGDMDLKHNPQVAADEFKLLQFLQSAGMAAPLPYQLDQSGEIFSTPYIIIEYIEGEPEFAPSDVTDFILQLATQLSRIHAVDCSHLDVSFLPQQENRFAEKLRERPTNITESDVFAALQTYLGSTYVNDFNLLGRVFRVTAQADAAHRLDPKDVLKIRVRGSSGETVPLGSFTTARDTSGPYRVPRYNLYPAAELDGAPAPGYSQGQAIELMQKLAAETLPPGFSFEWTTLAYQQLRAGSTAVFAFLLAVVFVFLVLAAQYESLTLPLAVILIVPMCLIASITGIVWRGMDNNILTQVGFIVLIGLAAKNAILIVEFARQLEDHGRDRWAAAAEAARLRLRPILMTSLAFIFGVVPLVWAIGAGAELRQALGTAVFYGMIGVTAFGLIFTPVFYVICRWLAGRIGEHRVAAEKTVEPTRQPSTP